MTQKKYRVTVGSVVEIDLKNGFYAYGRILEHANMAFYNFFSNSPLAKEHVKDIIQKDILFICGVLTYAVKDGLWKKVGKPLELENNLKEIPFRYIYDTHFDQYRLYNPNNGLTMPSTKEECVGLGKAITYYPETIEQRLINELEKKKI